MAGEPVGDTLGLAVADGLGLAVAAGVGVEAGLLRTFGAVLHAPANAALAAITVDKITDLLIDLLLARFLSGLVKNATTVCDRQARHPQPEWYRSVFPQPSNKSKIAAKIPTLRPIERACGENLQRILKKISKRFFRFAWRCERAELSSVPFRDVLTGLYLQYE